jgi:hypothetical protein
MIPRLLGSPLFSCIYDFAILRFEVRLAEDLRAESRLIALCAYSGQREHQIRANGSPQSLILVANSFSPAAADS